METAQQLTQEVNKFHSVIFYFLSSSEMWSGNCQSENLLLSPGPVNLFWWLPFPTLWLVVSSTIFRIASNVVDSRTLYIKICYISVESIYFGCPLFDSMQLKMNKKSFYLQTWHLSCYNLIQKLIISQPFTHPITPTTREWGGKSEKKLNLWVEIRIF